MSKNRLGIAFALTSAFLYAFISPISKLLNTNIAPFLGASFLYLGTFIAAIVVFFVRFFSKFRNNENKLVLKDIPNLVLASLFHSLATIFLLLALRSISALNASLITSLEIISTSVFALIIFKERITPLMWVGIGVIFSSIVLISLGDLSNFTFNVDMIFCLLSPICFGLANNFQKKISHKDPVVSFGFMGLFGFILTFAISLILKEGFLSFSYSLYQTLIGVFSYGISLLLFIYAERYIGASKTSAYFSIYPFISIIISAIIFKEMPFFTFYIGLGLLVVGYVFIGLDAYKNSADK